MNISVNNQPETPFELMYRAPGRENHQNITEILDEVMTRLENIEKTLQNLEKTT